MRTFGGEIGAALSAFAVLFGLAAAVFVFAFLLSLWWVDLAVAGVFALAAVALWQLSLRRTVPAPPRSPSGSRARPRVRRRRDRTAERS
jgi:membrane protein implicated in regulation of membrane protease activity